LVYVEVFIVLTAQSVTDHDTQQNANKGDAHEYLKAALLSITSETIVRSGENKIDKYNS
jgi:hypothetical protein